MTKKQILQILNDRSTYILDFKDETHNAIELEDFNYVADAILSLYSSSLKLEDKYTPTIEDYLKEVEGFDLSDTESYIEDYSINFIKYQKKYKKWLKDNL